MEIVWSKKAGETFQKNIDYLKENWTDVEVKKFVVRVFAYLKTLSEQPLISRKTYKTKNTHIGIIIPHISDSAPKRDFRNCYFYRQPAKQ